MFSDISTRILVFSDLPHNTLIKLPCLLVYLSLNTSESALYFSVRVQSDIAGSLMRFLRQKMGEGFLMSLLMLFHPYLGNSATEFLDFLYLNRAKYH